MLSLNAEKLSFIILINNLTLNFKLASLINLNKETVSVKNGKKNSIDRFLNELKTLL